MKYKPVTRERVTRETSVAITLDLDAAEPVSIDTSVPFFDHLLTAMAFHGNFALTIKAAGDIDVDAHHVVEDTGLVLGDVFAQSAEGNDTLGRFGHAVIPMDEALSEITIDVCGRSTCVLEAVFPQQLVGSFDTALLKEFFLALSGRAKISLHAEVRRGENSHHMAESLFKALGKAISAAYREGTRKGLSTKGGID